MKKQLSLTQIQDTLQRSKNYLEVKLELENLNNLCEKIEKSISIGEKCVLVVVAEGVATAEEVASAIKNKMNIDMCLSGHQHDLFVFEPNVLTPFEKLKYTILGKKEYAIFQFKSEQA